jgi:RNA polymerase sigma-70 factor, ECF subfamily
LVNSQTRSIEEDVLLAVGRGDPAAVQAVIDLFGGFVHAICRSVLADKGELEDAVAEVFADIWKSSPRFDPQVASAKSFVAMIARRRLIDRARRASVRLKPVSMDGSAKGSAGPMSLAGADAPIDQRATTSDELTAAMEALQELPTPEREMLLLNVARGWSHQKIAEYQRVPLGTVKSTLRRALTRIREIAMSKGLNGKNGVGGAGIDEASSAAGASGQIGGAS